MTVLPVAEYAPDRPDLSECTNIAENVIPVTADSYGPFNQLQAYSTNTIDTQCLGTGFAEDSTNGHHVYAGTAASIFRMDYGTSAWVTNGSGYTTGMGEYWEFTAFRNLMIATNYTNPIQVSDMTTGATFATLSSAAPNARHLAVTHEFLVAANTNDPVGGHNPFRIWWSANADPSNWPTPGSALAQQTQSDYTDLPGTQGQIMAVVPDLAGCHLALFFERGVFRATYNGPPDIFDFYPSNQARGTPARNSVVAYGAMVYYLGEDGFYIFDGYSPVPIGSQKVDRFFFNNVDPQSMSLVIGAASVPDRAILWFYRSLYAPTQFPDQVLIYRMDNKRWSHAFLTAQWIERYPMLASRVAPSTENNLTPGQLQLAAIDPTGALAYFTGPPMPATIGTRAAQLTQNKRTFVQWARALADGASVGPLLTEDLHVILTESGSPLMMEDDAPTVLVAFSARNNYYDPEVFGLDVPHDESGMWNFRSDGRYHRGRIKISAGLWHRMAGLDVMGIPAGER